MEDDLTDLPDIFSQAVLYKVVHTIEQQLCMTQRVSKREARQYLHAQDRKAINNGKRNRDTHNSISDKENQQEF